LRRADGDATLVDMDTLGRGGLLAIVEAEQERTDRQVAALDAVVAAIVEGSELTSTDDENDPEGATSSTRALRRRGDMSGEITHTSPCRAVPSSDRQARRR
jgi:hypothetical protein